MKKLLSLLILFSFSYPFELQSKPKGRTYAPEEGTFDRRKRIVIERKCRLIKEQKIPDDVICTYQPQPKEKGENVVFEILVCEVEGTTAFVKIRDKYS